MFKSLLLFFFILIGIALAVVGMVAYKVYVLMHNLKHGKPFMGATSNFDFSSFGNDKSSATSSRDVKGDGTIIDTRRPDVARRKIISSDEGEYVDFKE